MCTFKPIRYIIFKNVHYLIIALTGRLYCPVLPFSNTSKYYLSRNSTSSSRAIVFLFWLRLITADHIQV
ncbi:hypothetical protein VTN02DRAFT_408 [Thermoascus thermophilus]